MKEEHPEIRRRSSKFTIIKSLIIILSSRRRTTTSSSYTAMRKNSMWKRSSLLTFRRSRILSLSRRA